MPTYTFRCANCDHHFDLIQRFEDPDPTVCPICGHANELQRVYKPVGVVFKGSGFYATDNKSASGLLQNGSKSGANGSESDTTAQTEKKDTSKAEAAPTASSTSAEKD